MYSKRVTINYDVRTINIGYKWTRIQYHRVWSTIMKVSLDLYIIIIIVIVITCGTQAQPNVRPPGAASPTGKQLVEIPLAATAPGE